MQINIHTVIMVCPLSLTRAKHIGCYHVIVVHLFALFIGHDRHLGLVQVLCAGIVQVLSLAPANDCALGANGQLLILFWQTGESYVRRWNDLLRESTRDDLEFKYKY